MPAKKTHEHFVAEMAVKHPDIEVVGEYVNSGSKVKVRCKIDDHEWCSTASSMLQGHGCPKCAGLVRKPHQQFVAELATIDPNLEVIGEYVTSKTKIAVRCRIDGHTWFPTPRNLFAGGSCPKCNRLSKTKSHEQFIKDLAEHSPNIQALGQYVNCATKIELVCKADGYSWFSTPNNILGNKGCPKCSGKARRTHEQFEDEIRSIHKNIEVLGRYVSAHTKVKVKCLIDGYEWDASPNNLLRVSGCLMCSNHVTKTQEQFIENLAAINPNIEVLGTYVDTHTRIDVRCKVDGHVWSPVSDKLLRGSGCPKCAKYGYDSSKPANLYVFHFQHYLGFGITNVLKVREKQHLKTFKNLNIEGRLIHTEQGDGRYIQELERFLKKILPIVNSGVDGFKTEAILYEDREMLFKAIEEFHHRHNSPLQDS